MARFLDVHLMKGLDGTLIRNALADEFRVTHLNIMYNPEVDQCYCLIDASTMETVQKHHDKLGIKWD
ncbi:MAG TPA: nickel-binding protein [Candidatus Bathyarchaeia archaeon]|nr:nickel-binding protein [Candidatus Bathyarchaeia archaeon]